MLVFTSYSSICIVICCIHIHTTCYIISRFATWSSTVARTLRCIKFIIECSESISVYTTVFRNVITRCINTSRVSIFIFTSYCCSCIVVRCIHIHTTRNVSCWFATWSTTVRFTGNCIKTFVKSPESISVYTTVFRNIITRCIYTN